MTIVPRSPRASSVLSAANLGENGGSSPVSSDEVFAVSDEIERAWRRVDDVSFDPYDGIMATRVPAPLLRSRPARLVLVQLNKRLPWNIRPLLGIMPTRNVYAVAHFASAAVQMIGRRESDDAGTDALGSRLAWLRRQQHESGGWPYPFDVQTKTYYYDRSTPNVVCTTFAANAFLDAAEAGLAPDGVDVAIRAARFALEHLWVDNGDSPYFGYLPGDRELIHNGNVLAAQFVVRAGGLAGDSQMVERALEVLPTTTNAIAPDGSLLYGEGPHLAWVDGHHTGFVVEALHEIDRRLPEAGLSADVSRMARFYREQLFSSDGRPLARPRQAIPTDTISGAQGIQTLAKLGPDNLAFAARIARVMIDTMRTSEVHFVFQRGRFHAKKVPYARWSDAPMALALAVLGRALAGANGR
jgi:hypothetical protein